MNPHGPTLDARQIEACVLVFQGHSMREVGRRLDVDEGVVRKWAARPEWAEYIQGLESRARETSETRAIKVLGDAVERAAEVLVEIVGDPDQKAQDRIRAAVAVLDRRGVGPHSFSHDSKDLESRTAAELEDLLLAEADAIRARRPSGGDA